MHQAKKGNQWYFGMKTHIGVDESGQVHSMVDKAANAADVTQVDMLLHGDENVVCPTLVIPVWRNVPSMKVTRSPGHLADSRPA